MGDPFKYDVFLSHSHKDVDVVRELAESLRRDGLRVWLDHWEIKVGENIQRKIEEGLEQSRVLLHCMSRNAATSKWTAHETGIARFRDPTNEERRYIPIRLDDSEVHESIRPFLYVDYRPDRDRARAYGVLIDACKPPASERLPIAANARQSRLPVSDEWVRPFHVTEDRFLQLLLSEFTIVRKGAGFELRVAFDDDTPAIWNQSGKRHLNELLPPDRRRSVQKNLDDFLLGEGNDPLRGRPFEFRDDEFVFRYASGGTLPILNFGGNVLAGDYYCFFYRDVLPIGWNIANGGTDSRAELLNPQETIERELREELIVADFRNERRYVFEGDRRKPLDHPSHVVARRLWTKFTGHRSLADFKAKDIRIQWFRGPDSVRIENGRGSVPVRRGFFLNINGEDYGIEFDRVARIHLPENVTLFDGEMDAGHLVNAPIGLFEVNRFNARLAKARRTGGRPSFRPDYFFHSATLHPGKAIEREMKNTFIPHLAKFRTPEEIHLLQRCVDKGEYLGLCPVTERIVTRFRKLRTL